MSEITKAIIPIGGVGTRFLPLSKVVPKEVWPLVDVPVIHYIIEEAKLSGIRDIIFVINPNQKALFEYLEPAPALEKLLKERKKTALLDDLKKIQELQEGITISHVVQKNPLGDGHAILQAAKKVNDEPVACLFADDLVVGKTPCVAQLMKVFKTCEKPVIALKRLPEEKLPAYGIVGVERIASRLFKIKKTIEKPEPGEAPSDLAIVGKYIITPEVFQYLKTAEPSDKGEIILAEVFAHMLQDGKVIYGYEFEGEWLECGTKLNWLKSNLYLALTHPTYGPELKHFLKEHGLI